MGFPGFTEHGKVFCVQLSGFLGVFREVPVLPENRSKLLFSRVFTGFFSTKLLRFFVRETSRLFAGRAPGLSGNFYARALTLIADTEYGVGTGTAPYRIDSVSRRAGRYLET